MLAAELRAVGFAEIATRRFDESVSYGRDRALAMLRGRFASSFALIGDEEFRAPGWSKPGAISPKVSSSS